MNKKVPQYKQMSFETAVRNPERYLGILLALKDFENRVLDDENLLEIVSHLYLAGAVSSEEIDISKLTTYEDIKNYVIKVNSTRKADGGFPGGYPSRFWTYMRTLSELGMVYARYNEPFKLSEVANRLIGGEIDEQEAFSMQAMKCNRKSPYRNIKNDYNFFRFILEVLIILKKEEKLLSYEQFIVAMFHQNGNAQEFVNFISKNKFKNSDQVYEFVKIKYGASNKIKTVTRDYPDVVRRMMIIAGFITIRYSGIKQIHINEAKQEYIKELLNIEFNLSGSEKEIPKKYFEKLGTLGKEYYSLIIKYRKEDEIDGAEYTNKIHEIIKLYGINEDLIYESIMLIDSNKEVIPEFAEIPSPLKLEFYITILIALKYNNKFYVRPNYKADHIGKPYSHAPGNLGDIDVYSKNTYWLIEVTLIRNKTQLLNSETTSIFRHLTSNTEFKGYPNKFISLIAPVIHPDTKDFFDYALVNKNVEGKTYNIKDFIDVTLKVGNLPDMKAYTKRLVETHRSNLAR